MKKIAMSFQEAEYWSSAYDGDRDGIVFDGTHLLVPDALFAAVSAIEFDPLAPSRAQKASELTAACAAAIVGGFSSEALGTSFRYPSDIKDQINLMGSVTDSLLPDLPGDWTTPFWCSDANGIWAFRPHTAVEIRRVGRDGKAHVVSCQTTLDALIATAEGATTLEAVTSIAWPEDGEG